MSGSGCHWSVGLAGIPWNRISKFGTEAQTTAAEAAITEEVTARPRFFYGWVIVAVMAVTGALTMCMGALVVGTTPPPGVPRSAMSR